MPFLIWQGYVYFRTSTTYPASLTFMINEDEGGGLGAISGILGSFGLGGSKENNYDRILILSKSMRIVSEVLLTKVIVEGKEDYLGNHVIRIQKLQEEEWLKPDKNGNTPLRSFFFQHNNADQFSRLEASAVKSLYEILIGSEKDKPLVGSSLNEDSGIMALSAATRSEEMSIILLQTLFAKLSSFYVDKTIEKNLATYDLLRGKVDSMRGVLAGTDYRAATFEDRNHSLLMSIDKVPQQRYARDKQILMLVYGEAIKNLEVADFALHNKMPYVQAIDIPFAPLEAVNPSKKKALLLGLGLGLLLGCLFVVVRKILRDAMEEK